MFKNFEDSDAYKEELKKSPEQNKSKETVAEKPENASLDDNKKREKEKKELIEASAKERQNSADAIKKVGEHYGLNVEKSVEEVSNQAEVIRESKPPENSADTNTKKNDQEVAPEGTESEAQEKPTPLKSQYDIAIEKLAEMDKKEKAAKEAEDAKKKELKEQEKAAREESDKKNKESAPLKSTSDVVKEKLSEMDKKEKAAKEAEDAKKKGSENQEKPAPLRSTIDIAMEKADKIVEKYNEKLSNKVKEAGSFEELQSVIGEAGEIKSAYDNKTVFNAEDIKERMDDLRKNLKTMENKLNNPKFLMYAKEYGIREKMIDLLKKELDESKRKEDMDKKPENLKKWKEEHPENYEKMKKGYEYLSEKDLDKKGKTEDSKDKDLSKEKPGEAEKKAAEKILEFETSITKSNSVAELSEVVKNFKEPIQGSEVTFTPEEVSSDIIKVGNGELGLNYITRSFGLRKKVEEIIRANGFSE